MQSHLNPKKHFYLYGFGVPARLPSITARTHYNAVKRVRLAAGKMVLMFSSKSRLTRSKR